MHSIPLRFATTLSASVLGLAATSTCQGPTPAPSGDDLPYVGLPTFLREVPGGSVTMGLTTDQLFHAACQVSFPRRPDKALEVAEKNVETAMRRSLSMLGRQQVDVDTFLLAEWPVKNSEYEVFVALSRAEGTSLAPVKPPFGWWRYGRKDDYEKRLKEINKMFPGNKDGARLYWEQKGHELPYKLEDGDGNSIADHPVTYISYSDANRFAAWLGMRLPNEAEWTRAARGDGTHTWPWGNQGKEADVYSEPGSLEALEIFRSQDQVSKPVGAVKAAIGPYGHTDLFGNVWQLVAENRLYPINGTDTFAAEWKVLQKTKTVKEIVSTPPLWKDLAAVAKGGSYLSKGEPIQLLIDQRAPLHLDDSLESVGIRLAKSLRPGYDTLYSLLRGVYNRNRILPDQEPNLDQQFGAERYDLGENGFPKGYSTVSFAPMNWLEKGKSGNLRKMMEGSYRRPLVLGTLVTTVKINAGDLKGEIFTVLYRDAGQPRELTDAIKKGYRIVQAELKAAERRKKAGLDEKEDDKKKDDKKDKKKEDDSWKVVIKRYGLTEKDLEPKEAKNGLDFVRMDLVKIATDKPAFLLQGNEGRIVASIPAPMAKASAGKPEANMFEFKTDKDGKAVAVMTFGIPLVDKRQDRVAKFVFELPLASEAPTAEKPWRMSK